MEKEEYTGRPHLSRNIYFVYFKHVRERKGMPAGRIFLR
jgi:hypothetical protein